MTIIHSADDIHQIVLRAINNKSALLVAYSGGVDSSVLLHALVELKRLYLHKLEIRAIYIHHGLSENADGWAKHCQIQCEKWQIPLIIEKVNLNKNAGNIEAQARNARYQAIKNHQQHNEILCTAQHLDDQSETFFLALKRGSGPAGLSAMAQESKHVLRPLLSITRQQIEAYAHKHNIIWIEDESNQDEQFDRNFLRLSVLPVLNARWPHFSQMVTRSAELCQEQEQLIESLLAAHFQDALTLNGQIRIDALTNISDYKRSALLRMWFKSQLINMPSRQQLELIWQTVALAKQDANPQFFLPERQIRRYQRQLYLLPHYQHIEDNVLNWDLSHSLKLPDNVGMLHANYQDDAACRAANSHEKVTVRFHAEGKFHIVGRQGSRSIKKLWQERQVPSWRRTRTPLVFYNEQLITAVGVFITQEGAGKQIHFTMSPPE